jgi:hypothetical protein
MAKKPKKPAAPFVLSPAEWAPLQEAYDRVKTASGAIAVHDLRRHLRTPGVLPSARRAFVLDGTEVVETCELLDPAFWDSHSPRPADATIRVEIVIAGQHIVQLVPGYFFVRRQELDKLYPPPGPGLSSSDESLPSIGVRRGRKPTSDWQKLVTYELVDRSRAGKSVPAAREMCDWCIDKFDWQPDVSEMHKLIGMLRFLFP